MTEPDSLLPPNWTELAPLIDAVLDAPGDQRAAILDDLSKGNPQLRAELQKLVVECEAELPLLNRPAAESFAELFDEKGDIQVSGVLGDRYRIEREVGRGGMARVFLAHDIKHGRDVAVKVIRPDVAASLGSGRFLQEIAIAARLRHPNIVPMYDSGETGGVLYFVMPYEEGPSLRERMRQDAPLSLVERISILRDIARALAYAHERGVVHRDIKPDNVLLSGGAAVVSDFGIAKAVSAAQAESSGGSITQEGTRIGTPAYMAPEQAVGDPATDHRADIYSFGCLAYELFAGKPPFEGATTHEVIAAHIGSTPVSILDASTIVSRPVADLIMRCLQKRPGDRPQSAQELLQELETSQTSQETQVPARRSRSPARNLVMIAIGVALMVGIGYILSRSGWMNIAAPREMTVAVLPLLSSGDSAERELAYGMSDEIAAALVQVPGVRVMSRRGIAASPEQRDVDPEKTGRELGAQFLVMGSLRESAGRLSVIATLVQAKDGAVLWADQFDRSVDELRTVREEIARAVGDSLHRRSGAFGRPAPVLSEPVRAAEPYRLYILAQRALSLRGQSIQASADMFRQATLLDTTYAEAYSGLSLALALTPHFKPVSSKQVAADAITAARRALHLKPTLAEPHVALGIVHGHAYRWDSAGNELQTAVKLRGASDIEPLVQYGRYLLFRGQTAEGLRHFLIARNIEPASALVRSWVSYAYYLQGQMDSAIVEHRRAFQSDSTGLTTLGFGALILLRTGDVDGARSYLSRLNRYQHLSFYILAATGDTASARARIQELEQQGSGPWLVENSRAFTMLGARDTAGAITAFERATDANDIWPSLEPIDDPIFDPIRSSQRFQQLVRRIGLR